MKSTKPKLDKKDRRIIRLTNETESLRDWIRREGEVSNICTYHILNEVCQGCQCGRKNNTNK